MNKLKSYGYYFTDSISRFVKYLADALGITPDEPPIKEPTKDVLLAVLPETKKDQ